MLQIGPVRDEATGAWRANVPAAWGWPGGAASRDGRPPSTPSVPGRPVAATAGRLDQHDIAGLEPHRLIALQHMHAAV